MKTKDYNEAMLAIENAVKSIICAHGDKTSALAAIDTLCTDVQSAAARGVSKGFASLESAGIGEEVPA